MSKRKRHRGRSSPSPGELPLSQLEGILALAKTAPLCEEDLATLRSAIQTLAFLTQELKAKGTTVERLRKMLFGATTEKTSNVLCDPPGRPAGTADGTAAADPAASSGDATGSPPKRRGHGRNGVDAYPGAEKIRVPHPNLVAGSCCPECDKGKVSLLAPTVALRVQGMGPLTAKLYEADHLRCNLCGEVYTTEMPPEVGPKKYDETAPSMIGLLKYGAGLPFNRIEKLQDGMGIPLPAATQWELVEAGAKQMTPAHEELINQAAQADLLHNDDTGAKILEIAKEIAKAETDEKSPESRKERTGVFTSGIVAQRGEHQIALFVTGQQHAGENLRDVLKHRAAELATPIQMCDALSRNVPGEFKTLLANCLTHGRRNFVDVVDDFPDECRHVLEALGEVYKHDADARKNALSPEERLAFHKTHSGPVMEDLERWMRAQIDERKVEPNSGLGDAIGYMQRHWAKLTLFLHVAGAPLDNNICERALKKAILHRKNSYFFKTRNGARVGDLYLSLIHTAELNHKDPFKYLVALQCNHQRVAADPAEWMPWNYEETLARAATSPVPPT